MYHKNQGQEVATGQSPGLLRLSTKGLNDIIDFRLNEGWIKQGNAQLASETWGGGTKISPSVVAMAIRFYWVMPNFSRK
jgi:hypothetical protein